MAWALLLCPVNRRCDWYSQRHLSHKHREWWSWIWNSCLSESQAEAEALNHLLCFQGAQTRYEPRILSRGCQPSPSSAIAIFLALSFFIVISPKLHFSPKGFLPVVYASPQFCQDINLMDHGPGITLQHAHFPAPLHHRSSVTMCLSPSFLLPLWISSEGTFPRSYFCLTPDEFCSII